MPDPVRGSSSLFVRTLQSFLVALALLLVLLAGAVILGVARSAQGWTDTRSRETGAFLESLVLASFRARGSLEAGAIAASTLPYLTESSYLLVFAPDGSLVFGWRRGERLDGVGGAGARNFMARHAAEVRPVDLRDGGRVVGRVAAGVLSFSEEEANRGFLRTLALFGGIGAAASFLLAVGVAFLLSSRLSAQAALLSSGLARLAAGERGVSFEVGGARELARIGASAQALQERLAEEERIRRQWAADVAHDLRTPVAALRSQLEAMTDGVLAVTPERLGRASAELSRVESLVADLAELSRIESPGMVPSLADVEARPFLDDLCHRFSLEAERRRTALDCSCDEGFAFRGDRDLLLRAVSNVVDNALRHAGEGGRVEVRLSAAAGSGPGGWELRVENTGSIPDDEVPRVFDRLYRGDGARRGRGSGLGLTIAKAVVELHGGSIGIGNSGRGTVLVTMRCPAR